MLIEAKCENCRGGFLPRRSNQKFCSAGCRERKWHRDKPKDLRRFDCQQCGRPVETADVRKKYCSPECNWKAQNARRPRSTLDTKLCVGCGEKFRPLYHNTVYCSVKCRNRTNWKKNSPERSERHWEYRKKNKWGGNWYAAIERDNFTCQSCGIKSYPSQWRASKRKKLVVHHRDGSGEAADKNHSLDNLQTLCDPCHKEFHNIHLVYVDGKYYVAGHPFERLGIHKIETMPVPPR